MQNSARFQTTSEFDREYLRNGTRYPKSENVFITSDSSHVQRRKSCELWSTNYKELDVSWNPPKLHYSGDYISALRGCWPLKYEHALQIDQGLLTHTLKGTGVPPKNLRGTCQIRLKIQGVSAYKFGGSGNNVTKLFHATCSEAGMFKWALLLGKVRPLKFGRSKNV